MTRTSLIYRMEVLLPEKKVWLLRIPIMYVMGIQRRNEYFLKTNVMYFKSYVLSFE